MPWTSRCGAGKWRARCTSSKHWDFLGPILDEQGRCRGCVGQDLATMEIRALPADALILASGGCGADLRALDQFRSPATAAR